MGRKKRLRVADLAREAGISESKAVERLRRNGMEAREGYRIAPRDIQRAREILASENEAAVVREQQEPNPAVTDEDEGQPTEGRMTIQDAVETWLSMNPEPKHFRVAGRTYNDFVRSCYLFLLARALRQGITSTAVTIGSEDRRKIDAFLNRGKALWDERHREEQVEADARRLAREQLQAEEKRRIEELNRSEIQRQARLLQEDTRRLEKTQGRVEVHRKPEKHRAAEERHGQEDRRQSELVIRKNEQARIDQVFLRHHQAVENEGKRLQARLCSRVDYYAFVLRDRIERSAELLFGSAGQPNYEILKGNPKLLEELKKLTFGDDQHPGNYQNPYVSAYYTLRYEASYAFEYSQVYGLLLAIMRQQNETSPFDVISIGSGQGLDYWGLQYARSKQGLDLLKIGWQGIDLERWPDHILDDGVAEYSDGVDVREAFRDMSSLNAKVLMFPKVISELSSEVISFIVSWLEHVSFTRDVHYLCFIHTERNSLNPSDDKYRAENRCFHYSTDFALDAVKSAALISAARNGATRQSYSCEFEWCDSSSMAVSHYDVAWPDGQAEKEWRETYSYLDYGEKDVSVWEYDDTFEMSKTLRDAIKDIGYSCCSEYISSGADKDCDTQSVSCNDPYRCPLHRYPRFRTPRIAYQIVRLVKQPDYDEDIPF